MARLFIISLVISCFYLPWAVGAKKDQLNRTQIVEDTLDPLVHQAPLFQGGEKKMAEFIKNNVRYPSKACNAAIEGRLIVTFIVEKNGSFSDIKITKGLGYGLDEEAIRIIKAMPKWEPAKVKGKKVRSKVNVPFRFALTECPPPTK